MRFEYDVKQIEEQFSVLLEQKIPWLLYKPLVANTYAIIRYRSISWKALKIARASQLFVDRLDWLQEILDAYQPEKAILASYVLENIRYEIILVPA